MAGQDDHDALVADFCAMSGASAEQATQYLAANDWNIAAASNSYFQDADEASAEQSGQPATGSQANPNAASGIDPNYTGPRTLDGRPAPEAATQQSRRGVRSRVPPQSRNRIATLGSYGAPDDVSSGNGDFSGSEDSEDDDDGRGDLFAGGEKSGLAVKDPRQEGGPRKIISDILAKARANAARGADADPEAGPSRFRGAGVTLGGDGVESRRIPDPLGAPEVAQQPPQERVLHIWQDGFSIDDGALRRFDDPANQADLAMIRSGRAPLHLMNVQHDQPVDVKLHQHDTPYTPQAKKYKPFGGEGRRLGSPVPGDGNTVTASITTEAGLAPAPAAAVAAAAASSSPSSTPAVFNVDSSQPTLMIRVQMPDGTRLPARFNTTHTIGDVYSFIQSASAETRHRDWVLATTFPNKDHTDKSLVLGDMAEFKKGGTAVVKWV